MNLYGANITSSQARLVQIIGQMPYCISFQFVTYYKDMTHDLKMDFKHHANVRNFMDNIFVGIQKCQDPLYTWRINLWIYQYEKQEQMTISTVHT